MCGLGALNDNLTTASHNNLVYVSNYVVIQHAHVILSVTNDVCAMRISRKLLIKRKKWYFDYTHFSSISCY